MGIRILVLLGLMFCTVISNAQVKSSSFNFTLKMLLSRDVPEITVADAAKYSGQYMFLDAREQKEYNVSHLPSSRLVGYNSFSITSLNVISKDRPLVVYCSIGKRSEDIARKLKKAGFINVHNLYGGIFEWINLGQQVYDHQNKPTDKIHAYGRFWGRFLDKGKKVY